MLAVEGVRRFLFVSAIDLTDSQRLLRARFALGSSAKGSAYNLAEHLSVVGVEEDGAIELQLKLVPHLHNFFASMHGGAIASVVDVATSIALCADGGFPGVSTSLGVSYLNGCSHDEQIKIVPRVLKRGATLAFTECKLYRMSDGKLMARGWHVKYIVPPRMFRLLLALRPSITDALIRRLVAAPGRVRLGGRTLHFSAPPSSAAAAPDNFDHLVERDTGYPRSEEGKLRYFSSFGGVSGSRPLPMQGWDKPLESALCLESPSAEPSAEAHGGGGRPARPDETSRWTLVVGEGHVNTLGTLHGGCTASLVDVLGSAAVAFGDAYECGVAVSLDVQYLAPAKLGDRVTWEANIIKRGATLVTAEVTASVLVASRSGSGRRRPIAVGTVTKSLRGLASKARKGEGVNAKG